MTYLFTFKWTQEIDRVQVSESFLKFKNCGTNDCFGQGRNFGSPKSPVSCVTNPGTLPANKCVSPMCARGLRLKTDVSQSYFYIELFVALIFSFEIVMTYLFSYSGPVEYFSNVWSWIDILATVPSIITIILALAYETTREHYAMRYLGENVFSNFLESGVFKVFRFFKIFKHIPQVSMLVNTFVKVADQLMMVYAFMCLIVMMLAIVFYYMENGRECFYEGVEYRDTLEDDSRYSGRQRCTEEDERMLEEAGVNKGP